MIEIKSRWDNSVLYTAKDASDVREAVKAALVELVKAGEVEKEGKARGVRYSIPGVPAAKPTGNVKKIAPRRGHSYPWEGEAA